MTHGVASYPLESTNNDTVDIEKSSSGTKAIAVKDLEVGAKLDLLLEELVKIRIALEISINQEIQL